MSNGKDGPLENQVVAVIKSDDAQALIEEYVKVGLDAFIETGVAQHIPIVSTIVGVTKIGLSIHDRIFMKKSLELMAPLSSLKPDERRRMVERLEGDANYGRKVGEHLLELLDRIESVRKPRMISRVFLAYLQNEVDAVMLHRLLYTVERIPIHEISSLRIFCERKPEERDAPLFTLQSLASAGLLDAQSAFGGMAFQANEIGTAFLSLRLDAQD
jgi:hypothetical protein